MIGLSAVVVSSMIGFAAAHSFDSFVDGSYQLHGESESMVLDLLKPVDGSYITKVSTGCPPRSPADFTPVKPHKLRSVYWSNHRIFEVPEEDEETIEKVTVYNHCYDALVAVNFGGSNIHFYGRDGDFEFISENKFQEELRDMNKMIVVDINNTKESEYVTFEEEEAYGIKWYNIVPAQCFYSDKVVAGDHVLWTAANCHERFGGATVYVSGNEKLVAMLYHTEEGLNEALFHATDEVYQKLTLEQFDQHFKALEEKFAAGKASVENEARQEIEEHQ